MQAIKEIDAAATGRVEVREYAVKQPRYARFALAAVVAVDRRAGIADDAAHIQDVSMTGTGPIRFGSMSNPEPAPRTAAPRTKNRKE